MASGASTRDHTSDAIRMIARSSSSTKALYHFSNPSRSSSTRRAKASLAARSSTPSWSCTHRSPGPSRRQETSSVMLGSACPSGRAWKSMPSRDSSTGASRGRNGPLRGGAGGAGTKWRRGDGRRDGGCPAPRRSSSTTTSSWRTMRPRPAVASMLSRLPRPRVASIRRQPGSPAGRYRCRGRGWFRPRSPRPRLATAA